MLFPRFTGHRPAAPAAPAAHASANPRFAEDGRCRVCSRDNAERHTAFMRNSLLHEKGTPCPCCLAPIMSAGDVPDLESFKRNSRQFDEPIPRPWPYYRRTPRRACQYDNSANPIINYT